MLVLRNMTVMLISSVTDRYVSFWNFLWQSGFLKSEGVLIATNDGTMHDHMYST